MRIKDDKILIEVFADEGKILDLGEHVYSEYACLPKNYDLNLIIEIWKKDLPDEYKDEFLTKTITGSGMPFDPFKNWEQGIEVHDGEWWAVDNVSLRMAKKDGIPSTFDDEEFWEII